MIGTLTGSVRRFQSLGQFAAFLEKQAAMAIPVGKLALGGIANTLYNKTRKEYGDQVLPELAQSTQDERVALGYTANDPLLRDGSLLRDSVEMDVGEDWAGVGSSEPIAEYHEFGYYNVRAQTAVPPRQAFRIGLEESVVPIRIIVQKLTGIILGFEMATFGDVASGTSMHMLSASAVDEE